MLAVTFVGVVGYHLTADLPLLDALYMTVITLSTVGFREVVALDADAKVFTIVLILGGAGVLAFAVTTIIDILLDEQTMVYFQLRRNLRRTRRMKDHFVICGLGRVGRSVAEELALHGVPFLVIDRDPEAVTYASSRGWLTIPGDATDDAVLEQAGITRARGLVACVNSDADNLFIVVTARGLNGELQVSTRVSEESSIPKFRRAGANHVYSPYSLLGRKIARSVTHPRVLQLLDLALEQNEYDITMDECLVPEGSPLIGKTLADSRFRQRFGAHVLSIVRGDRSIAHNPTPDTTIGAGDILILLGTQQQLEAVCKEAGLRRA